MQTPGRESSPARPALLIALVVVALIIITIHARESASGPVHVLRTGVQAAVRPAEIAGSWVTTPLRSFGGWVSGFGASRAEVTELRTQNAELRKRNAELEEARQENERLRALVGLVEAQQLESLGARVIGRPTNSWEGVITIDRGSDDGVTEDMPVIGADGLLGQTVSVTPHSAKVRLITDQQSGVAALLQSSRAEGVARGSVDRKITLDFVSKDTTVTVGDVVITSGMGGVYPKGLVIGEVSDVEASPGALNPLIYVRPAAGLSGIEEVLVLTGPVAVPETGSSE